MEVSKISPWESDKNDQQDILPGDLLHQQVDYTNDNLLVQSLAQKVDNLLKQERLNYKMQNQAQGQQSKKAKKIIVNTSKARSEMKLLRYLINVNNWSECFNYSGNILWSGLPLPNEEWAICYDIMTNRIPGMQELAHKKETGYFLNKFREYFPEDFDFFPRTFLIPEELSEFEVFFKKHSKKLCIAKPSSGCQGDGINIVRTFKDLPISSYTPHMNQMVVQQYIDDPLLVDKKKFDLRLYVLIASVDPFIVYFNDEGMARFCTEEYQPPTQENLKNLYMHLTNYSLNKDSPNFKLPNDSTNILEINDTHKRTYTSVKKSIEQQGLDINHIQDEIQELIIKFLTSMHPYILYNFKSAFYLNKKEKPKCFHVLGFDIILDSKGKPWLLEVNANPSFNIEHEIYFSTGKTTKEDSPLDKYIKAKVVGDTIPLVLKSVEKQLQIGKDNYYKSWKQIICGSIEEKKMELIKNMLTIYGKLSGLKFKGAITALRFVKLADYSGMTNNQITKTDYDIIFKKLLRDQSTQSMDFYNFIRAIEYLAQRLISNFNLDNKLPAVEELVNNLLLQMNQ